MAKITFDKDTFQCKEGENLLDAFFRNKIDVPFSCRNGACQACLAQLVDGQVDHHSQLGLSQSLIDAQYFLPCKCIPTGDMVVAKPNDKDLYQSAVIHKLKQLSDRIMLVCIKVPGAIKKYRTGQFINVKTLLDKKIRSYSLSNVCDGHVMAFHVQKINSGVFSSWVFDHAKVGDKFDVNYPLGDCYATHNFAVLGKLIVATGSGLGAALAVARDELSQGFGNDVVLYHSSKNDKGLYLLDELKELSAVYTNFHYQLFTVSDKSSIENVIFADVNDYVASNHEQLQNWEVYLYGNSQMVMKLTQTAISLGCLEGAIYKDAFEYSQVYDSGLVLNDDEMEFVEEKKRYFEPDLAMWNALGNGQKLKEILDDFYDKVLVDDLLSPFFKGVTKDHIVGKQYAFFNQIYTGKDCYFGDRPRNAHHWMVISNELFDYRERLFEESCIKCGLAQPYLNQILAFHESYRNVIVKTRIWPRITDGEIKPLKGYEELRLDIGAMCDGCGQEVVAGELVHYHDLTGEIFCRSCGL